MDFITIGIETGVSVSILCMVLTLLFTWIAAELDCSGKTVGILFGIFFLIFAIFLFIPLIGVITYSPTDYYEPKQIKTIYHDNSEVSQYAYRHNGEKINVVEVYGTAMHEDTIYREMVIDHSFLFWNFEQAILERRMKKIFEFSPNGKF